MEPVMKKLIIFCFLLIPILFGQTRKPEVAGQFYSADAQQLKTTIDFFLSSVTIKNREKPAGLICPHAGYYYSGQVAAAAFKQIENHTYETIIILSPSHRIAFDFISVFDGDYYESPLGKIPVNKTLATRIASKNNGIQLSSIGHIKKNIFQPGEHAIEVQLPFLQSGQSDFQIVPIVIGTQDYGKIKSLGEKLKELRKTENLLIIASSDLSHYHSYEKCKEIDQRLMNAVKRDTPEKFYKNLNKKYEACGGSGITVLKTALGADCKVEILKYANSGDVKKADKNQVVGYTAVVFYERKETEMGEHGKLLTIEEQKLMLKLAEETVKSVVNGEEPEIPENLPPVTLEKRGAFVTLNKNQQLRGCIGYIVPIKPLYETIIEMGEAAALRDPRFNPVEPEELAEICSHCPICN
jgi:AmmeMemoRadiSam system protein B